MSFVITDTSPVFTSPLTVASAPVGTNPNSVDATTAPVQLGGVGDTWTTVAAGAGELQQVVLSGSNTRLNLNTGAAVVQVVGGGNIVEAVQGDTAGKIISLGSPTAPYNGAVVSTAEVVSGNNPGETVSIASAAGGQSPAGGFAYYAHGGQGADQIEGSSLSDFIRGGAGADTINGFGGDDLIRGGAGSDSIFMGPGADSVYYTVDQLDGSTDTLADFATGADVISVDSTQVASTASISGLGTNTVTLNGAGGSVRIVSQGTAINQGDINFI